MLRSQCPVSGTLDIIGDKWTLLLIRDAIVFKKTTYKEFKNSPEGIATNILASRLKLLVEHGIFSKEGDSNNKLIIHYKLTEKGKELEPVMRAMGKWGITHIEGPVRPQEA